MKITIEVHDEADKIYIRDFLVMIARKDTITNPPFAPKPVISSGKRPPAKRVVPPPTGKKWNWVRVAEYLKTTKNIAQRINKETGGKHVITYGRGRYAEMTTSEAALDAMKAEYFGPSI